MRTTSRPAAMALVCLVDVLAAVGHGHAAPSCTGACTAAGCHAHDGSTACPTFFAYAGPANDTCVYNSGYQVSFPRLRARSHDRLVWWWRRWWCGGGLVAVAVSTAAAAVVYRGASGVCVAPHAALPIRTPAGVGSISAPCQCRGPCTQHVVQSPHPFRCRSLPAYQESVCAHLWDATGMVRRECRAHTTGQRWRRCGCCGHEHGQRKRAPRAHCLPCAVHTYA